jgi:hypothetical protein
MCDRPLKLQREGDYVIMRMNPKISSFMENILTLQEMSDRYNNEWLLIAYTELDENMIVVRGEVLAHSPNQGDVYEALPIAKGRNVAFEYVGTVPTDFAVML